MSDAESSFAEALGLLPEALRSYDLLDLIGGGGGLQLLPQNAKFGLRLEYLVAILAGVEAAYGRPQVAKGRWRRLVREPPIGSPQITLLEDPPEDTFSASLAFEHDVFRIVRGRQEDSAETTELLFRALKEAFPYVAPEAAQAVRSLSLAVLRLSETIIEKAGIGRNEPPPTVLPDHPLIPDAPTFSNLKRATVFTANELLSTVGADGLQALGAISVNAGSVRYRLENPDYLWKIHLRPIVRVGDDHVVAVPSALPVALMHAVVRWSRKHNVDQRVADGFCRLLATTIENVVNNMGWAQMPPLNQEKLAGGLERIYRFDRDKFAHVLTVSDDFSDYSESSPYTDWAPSGDDLRSRVDEIGAAIRTYYSEANVLHLVIAQGIGRPYYAAVPIDDLSPNSELLAINPRQLSIMGRELGSDPLGLWKYARTVTRFGRENLMAHSELDIFAEYRNRQSSLYFSDDAPAPAVLLTPELGASLIIQDAERHDVHNVRLGDGAGVMMVRRVWQETTLPVYAPISRTSEAPTLLVECDSIQIWIVAEMERENGVGDRSEVVQQFCEGVGYWLAEALPSIKPTLDLLSRTHRSVRIRVVIGEDVLDPGNDVDLKSDWVEVTAGAPEGIDMFLRSGTAQALTGPTNSGERRLLEVLLLGIDGILPADIRAVAPLRVPEAVERHAPLGPKKWFVFTDGSARGPLLAGPLPSLRTLQEGDVEDLLDILGPQVRAETSMLPGDVQSDRRTEVLNSAVRICFLEIEKRVSRLRVNGLLEQLVARHEAIVQEHHRKRLIISPMMARIGAEGVNTQDLREGLELLVQSDQAMRFLIEYVAAKPPGGDRAISLSELDHLVALANQVIDKGMLSDAIHFARADLGVSFLASGRIGLTKTGRYTKGVESFKHVQGQEMVEGAGGQFREAWSESREVDEPDWLPALNEACADEFGLTMTDIAVFFGELISIASDWEHLPAWVPLTPLVSRVATSLEWDETKVRVAVDTFSLRPRDAFFPSASRLEAAPWRFNRDLSYVRRPLLLIENPEPALLWGSRHLLRCAPYVMDLIISGQFRAKSSTMQSFMGRIRQEIGEEFNDRVAAEFERFSRYQVCRRAERFGGKRIERSPAEPLGDIDVLVVDRARRTVIAVETKDFGLAKTPAELANEISEFDNSPGSTVRKHSERVTWLQRNQVQVLKSFGIEAGRDRWRTKALIVVGEALIGVHIQDLSMEVLTFSELQVRLAGEGL